VRSREGTFCPSGNCDKTVSKTKELVTHGVCGILIGCFLAFIVSIVYKKFKLPSSPITNDKN